MAGLSNLSLLKYTGTGCGVAGAALIAANIPASAWAFPIFFISSTSWLRAAQIMRDRPLAVLNLAFTAINALGIYRWLILGAGS